MQKAVTEEAILRRSPGLQAFKDATDDPRQERQRRAFMELVAELDDHDLALIDLLFSPKPPLRNADEIRAEFHDPLTAAKALAQLAEELRASTRPLFVNVVARLLDAPGFIEWVDADSDIFGVSPAILASNPHLDADAIRTVWNALLEWFGEFLDSEDVYDLAANPQAPPDVLKALAALGNVGVTKRLARYGNLPPDLLVDLLKTKWQQRQALARSRRVMDAAIAVLCEDADERVHHYARKEWKRRHREERPGAERLAQARAEIAALGCGQVKRTDDDLLALYTQDPERWPELIQDPGAGLKLLRAGFRDGRDPRPSPFYRRRYARDVDFIASLLPSGAKLHAQAAESRDLLFLIACLIRYETSKTPDERLADALVQNSTLRKIGIRELTMAGAIRVWNWDYVETSPYYPRRTAALDARMKGKRA